jgi:tetratricopeptide (TPR) repeat protein
VKTLTLLVILLTPALLAADEALGDLEKIEAALRSAPDDLKLHYRKCRALFALGKEQEAIDHAAVALEKFKKAGNDLPWMLLGSLTTDAYRIDVHYNMGRQERAAKKDGIVRPYSFRVWELGEPKLVRILDFELAYIDGQLLSAAVGETTRAGHANFGIVDPKSDFATIKKKVLTILER